MFDNISYRDAVPGEANSLGLVNAHAYANRDGVSLPRTADERVVSLIKERMAKEGSLTRVAVAGGEKVVGFVLTYPRSMNEEPGSDMLDTAQLSFLAVDPDYQGRGIARSLVDEAIQEARNAGLKWMSLWTDENKNERARLLYERRGFILTGESRQGVEGQYADQVVYQLDLQESSPKPDSN